jgi:Zn-dependent peptidase ImmA (M78 family)
LVADYFAACVLMPKKLVKRRFGEGLRTASQLAAEFGVSPVAMQYRLHQLGLLERYRRCVHGDRPLPDFKGYFRRAWAPEALQVIGV